MLEVMLLYTALYLLVSAGEESGVSLFKRELEAETSDDRDEQVHAPLVSRLVHNSACLFSCL